MWIGLLFGAMYAVTEFRGEVRPKFELNCGPFKNGYLVICGTHITHWMCATPLVVLSLILGKFDLFSLSVVMIIHGLVYSDRCGIPADPTVIQADAVSELSESESEGETLDVVGELGIVN